MFFKYGKQYYNNVGKRPYILERQIRSIIYLKGLKLFSYYYSALTRKLENQIWNTGMANTLQEMYHILRTFLINSASFTQVRHSSSVLSKHRVYPHSFKVMAFPGGSFR